MGFIKEPEGVDFVIQSEPLTEDDKIEISKYIEEYKAKLSLQNHRKRKHSSKLDKQKN